MKLKTRRRYNLCGSDYSSQEVRMFSATTQDPSMIKVFLEGRDLYSEVASMVYKLDYNECCEFRKLPDGTKEFNLDGKKRRTACKSLILGLQYGRGIKSIAEQIKSHDGPVTKADIDEAKKLSDDFFHNYPKAKEWMEGNYRLAREQGYVEDLWGRRRRLPDASLPKYEFSMIDENDTSFNPLLGSVKHQTETNKVLIQKYTERLDHTRSNEDRKAIIQEAAKKDHLNIVSNSGFIAQAERQSINSPIQGGSATMTKLAMRNIFNDDEMKKLDFHLLIPVHDELIGEAPLWNIEKSKKRMEYLMIHAGEPECKVPMKCDADSFEYWYQDVLMAHVKEDFEKFEKELGNKDLAMNKIYDSYSEFLPEQLDEYIKG